jgi:hypothetical protein
VQRVTGIEVLDQEHAEHADEMRPARQAHHVDDVIKEVDAGVGRQRAWILVGFIADVKDRSAGPLCSNRGGQQPQWAIPGAGLAGVR